MRLGLGDQAGLLPQSPEHTGRSNQVTAERVTEEIREKKTEGQTHVASTVAAQNCEALKAGRLTLTSSTGWLGQKVEQPLSPRVVTEHSPVSGHWASKPGEPPRDAPLSWLAGQEDFPWHRNRAPSRVRNSHGLLGRELVHKGVSSREGGLLEESLG